MEIDYSALKRVVERANFGDMEELSYSGVNYLLFPCEYSEEERENGEPPVFFQGSTVADWDIYFAMKEIDERFRKPVLLHELVEAERYGKLVRDGLSKEEASVRSHDIAVSCDDKYAKELLSAEDYNDYSDFVKRVRR